MVVSLTANGEFLKEIQGEVYLPFNSTYEIYLKNTVAKTALVTIRVDDKLVIDNLLVYGYTSTTIKRFHEGNNSAGHSLRFIPFTDDIKQHRGEKASDGKLKVTWKYEDNTVKIEPYIPATPSPWWPKYPWDREVPPWNGPVWINTNKVYCGTGVYGQQGPHASQCYSQSFANASDISFLRSVSLDCDADKGITTTGAPLEQTFTEVDDHINWEWKTHEIILKMFGADRALKKRVQCEMCGTTVNVKQGPYCPKCGTYLL